ncbi:chaplin family protein [Streptomyces sp. NPDC056149]|uniref:chaplin n=1 Tax=unclassified Streptomyces TaxID=2593676 RepID=UPI002381694B|nr:chaplin family protein [Streptomyces sp. WZ-12]
MRQVARKGLITMAAAGGVLAMAAGYAHADSAAAGGAAHSPGVGSGNAVQAPIDVPVNVCGNTVDVVGVLNPAFGNKCANASGGHHGHGQHAGQGREHDQGGKHRRTAGGHGGATAVGRATNSPGIGSGNVVQAPIDVPVNVCGNSVDVVGLLNPTFGNDCANVSPTSPGYPHHPGHPTGPGQPPERGHHPRDHGNPEHPGHPQTGKPEQPVHQAQPVQPVHPGHPHHPGSPHEPRSAMPEAPGVRTQTVRAPHTQVVSTPRRVERHEPQLAQTGAGALGYAVPLSAGMLLGGAVLYRRARTAGR